VPKARQDETPKGGVWRGGPSRLVGWGSIIKSPVRYTRSPIFHRVWKPKTHLVTYAFMNFRLHRTLAQFLTASPAHYKQYRPSINTPIWPIEKCLLEFSKLESAFISVHSSDYDLILHYVSKISRWTVERFSCLFISEHRIPSLSPCASDELLYLLLPVLEA